MMSLSKPIATLLVFALWACDSNSQLHQSIQRAGTTEMTQVVSTETGEQAPIQKTEAEEAIAIADEPVPIGGAFLACFYPDGQKQGDSEYRLNCQLKLPKEVAVKTASASFRKIDGQGTAYPLTVTQEDITNLSWVITESPATLYYRIIESTISINDSAAAILRTEISSTTMSIQRVESYWLAGEPNNLATAGGLEEEDCTEYSNLAAKNEHAVSSGLASGPLGRANDTLCSISRNFLCKNVQDTVGPKWSVSTVVAPFFSYATACPAGYRFALPMGEVESQEVNALIDQRTDQFKLWVPLHDTVKEAEFRVML